jgi:anaerobic selenocysteine-containing dehydrogenase
LLTEQALKEDGAPNSYVIWDERKRTPFTAEQSDTYPALSGTFNVKLKTGETIECRPAFDLLKTAVAPFAPEHCEAVTTVPAEEIRKAVRLFAHEKPSCYCTWVGLEQDNEAMQTNRGVCIFYALTGQFDQRGSNVIFDTPRMNPIAGRELLPKAMTQIRLGAEAHPLGPQFEPGLVQAAEVYDAILTEHPYPVKAMVLFGSDPVLGHGDPLRGKAALEALDFYVHVDIAVNPSALFADLLLPASTCWEREALMPFFEIAEDTMNWVQLRPAVVPPLHESRPDTEIIFALATKLGLGEHFFNGDTEAALNYQLAPCGLTLRHLRDNPGGLRLNTQTRYRKYAESDSRTRQSCGFDTPTRKIEIYSTTFANAGYPPLPAFKSQIENDEAYPLVLTFFRDIHFCDEQHRNIPRLRRAVPEPFLEIHPGTAHENGIMDGEWIFLEAATGKVKLKARFNDSLHPKVVASVYGWWQACKELKRDGHDPFSQNGANANLLVRNADSDPISASVAHRGQRCRISKL